MPLDASRFLHESSGRSYRSPLFVTAGARKRGAGSATPGPGQRRNAGQRRKPDAHETPRGSPTPPPTCSTVSYKHRALEASRP